MIGLHTTGIIILACGSGDVHTSICPTCHCPSVNCKSRQVVQRECPCQGHISSTQRDYPTSIVTGVPALMQPDEQQTSTEELVTRGTQAVGTAHAPALWQLGLQILSQTDTDTLATADRLATNLLSRQSQSEVIAICVSSFLLMKSKMCT